MKDQKRPIIIFCQAPADTAYVLTLYEKFKGKRSISIYVINVEGTYKHLKLLNLNVYSLRFIPYPDLYHLFRSPRRIIKVRRDIALMQKQFKQIKFHEVYYSNNLYDWITFACIYVMRDHNDIFVYDYYNTTKRNAKPKLTVKNVILLLVLYYITRVKLQLDHHFNNKSVPFFPYYLYGIRKYNLTPSPSIFKKYVYSLEDLPPRAVLLFESDMKDDMTFINYEATISTVIKRLLKEGYKIYIKPHPRIGYSKFLDRYDITVLLGFISGEFLPLDQFQAVLGIWTTTIAKISESDTSINVVSILELFHTVREKDKDAMRQFLMSQSNSKLKFAKSVGELINIINCESNKL